MNRKRTLTLAQQQEQALEAYIESMQEARAALDRINQFLEDNGETGPEDVHWGHVGSMQRIASQLTELKDMIDGTGEYSEA